jgi:hypothetical protein
VLGQRIKPVEQAASAALWTRTWSRRCCPTAPDLTMRICRKCRWWLRLQVFPAVLECARSRNHRAPSAPNPLALPKRVCVLLLSRRRCLQRPQPPLRFPKHLRRCSSQNQELTYINHSKSPNRYHSRGKNRTKKPHALLRHRCLLATPSRPPPRPAGPKTQAAQKRDTTFRQTERSQYWLGWRRSVK